MLADPVRRVGAGEVKVQVHTDGASRGNPGPAGLGVVIQDASGKTLRKIKQNLGQTTNNVAEYLAIIFALEEALELGARSVTVLTDSELVVRQLNREYKIKDAGLKPLFLVAEHLRKLFREFEIRHIPREENTAADKLAGEATESLL